MSSKNKIISNEAIENILIRGYVACKDCKPDKDAKFITSEEIREFEKILHDEFGFGKEYTDKLLNLLSNLYEGININKKIIIIQILNITGFYQVLYIKIGILGP